MIKNTIIQKFIIINLIMLFIFINTKIMASSPPIPEEINSIDDIKLLSFEILTRQAGVSIENDGNTLVIEFAEYLPNNLHTTIDLHRIGDLEYKTRIMRYFGGMLKNNTYHFKELNIKSDYYNLKMPFTRENVSFIVNLICCK